MLTERPPLEGTGPQETDINPGRVAADTPRWRLYVNGVLAAEISRLTRYFDALIQWQPRREDGGILLALLDSPSKSIATDLDGIRGEGGEDDRRAVLLNANLNHDLDIEETLRRLKGRLSRGDRLILVVYNPYYRFLYWLVNKLKIRSGELPTTFITHADLRSIAALTGYEAIRVRPCVYLPWRLLGLGGLVNRTLPALPLVRWLGLTAVILLRPVLQDDRRPSVSVVIPARNERGNVASALERVPTFGGAPVEVLFVEGHSTDGTWEEIQRLLREYRGPHQVRALRQSGKGKADAVRLGFSAGANEVLTILDADLTMPPEMLERFYRAYSLGLADFINGDRLVYPMEGEAMRFLNYLGNVFFAKALSFVLDTRLGDSLCGTKLLSRRDYRRFERWRADFGEFDPFGDFELLFPATLLGLGTIDLPVRYRQRTYGHTNISRFRHGAMLLKMTWVGLWRIKLASPAAAPRT